jgi:hypothetical protein
MHDFLTKKPKRSYDKAHIFLEFLGCQISLIIVRFGGTFNGITSLLHDLFNVEGKDKMLSPKLETL